MVKNVLKVAAIQLNSTEDKENNLDKSKNFILKALKNGAGFIALPEVFNFRGNLNKTAEQAEKIPGHTSNFISKIAKENKVWILCGSIMEKDSKKSKPFNTSILINPRGEIEAKYRKIHLFDIKLKGKVILESSRNQAGTKPSITRINNHKMGMSICYDLRFPELYRKYSELGAEIICIPSSFTKPTGSAHWETLIRARAIENQCFVIAPNQAGTGSSGIKTYGHSMIIDPWGVILARADGEHETIIYADLNFNDLKKIRENLPALKHRKIKFPNN